MNITLPTPFNAPWRSKPHSHSSRRRWPSIRFSLLGLLSMLTGSLSAAPIDVTTTDAFSATECTLADAIATAKAEIGVGQCLWGGESEVALEEQTYETNGVLPFVIGSGDTIRISGAGGSTAATIQRETTDPINRFFSVSGTLDLANVTLKGGKQSSGGAVFVSPTGALGLDGCQFLENSATSVGGAIYNRGTLTVDKCTFDDNSATHRGGAIYLTNDFTATIFGSTFVANSANYGGAINLYYAGSLAELGLENSTFSANAASRGGAIYQHSGYTLAEMCTFKGNTASSSGGSLYRSGGTLELSKSAVAGTSLCSGTISSLGYNAAEDSSCGLTATGDMVVADLDLSADLLDHGGLTMVHVPLHDSPLFDNYLCDVTSDAGDQRDVFDRYPTTPGNPEDPGNYGQNEYCDIGAYESICETGHGNWGGAGEYLIFVYEGQATSSSREVLNNGACKAYPVDFGGEPSNCSIKFYIYGASLQLENIWLLRQSCLDTHFDGGKDCFSNPEGCKTTCAFNPTDATDLSDFNGDLVVPTQGSGFIYTINVPACDWDIPDGETTSGIRSVIEFANGAGFDFWDPEIESPSAPPTY